jgi:hypothetical protein
LLCWYHHEHVHRRGIEMHRRGSRWIFTDSNGTELLDPRPDDPASDAVHHEERDRR